MSTLSDSLSIILSYFCIILGSLMLVIGTIATLLGVIIFSRKTMRQNPGCIYFMTYYIINFIMLYVFLFPSIIIYLGINPSLYNISYCKIFLFLQIITTIISPYYLVLASIDRAFISSRKVSKRQLSTHRFAYWSIFIITLFFILLYFHLIIIINIYQIYPNYPLCYYPPGIYRVFIGIINLIIKGLLPSFLLIIFGLITFHNIHQRVIQPIRNAINIHRSKDRQLIIILLVEIFTYVPLAILSNLFTLYRQCTQYQSKSADLQAIEYFTINLFYLFYFIPISINFYIYLFVSKSFRKKTYEILFQFWRRDQLQVFPINN
ncbi:hypothetical protein I4U23_017199 [Adineta vaga]|nr:hypothetical protein I4U23_017199 [Adineta vaga]